MTVWLSILTNHLERAEAQAVITSLMMALAQPGQADPSRPTISASSLYGEIVSVTSRVPDPHCRSPRCHRCQRALIGPMWKHVWPTSWPYHTCKRGMRPPLCRSVVTPPFCDKCIRAHVNLVPFGRALRETVICVPAALIYVDWKVSYRTKSLVAPAPLVFALGVWFEAEALARAPPTYRCLAPSPMGPIEGCGIAASCHQMQRLAALADQHQPEFWRRNRSALRRVPWFSPTYNSCVSVVRLDSLSGLEGFKAVSRFNEACLRCFRATASSVGTPLLRPPRVPLPPGPPQQTE